MPFSSSQPSIRARVLPRFPAQVLAGNGMIITKNGGTYIFETTGEVATLDHLPDIGTDTLIGRDSAGTGPPTQINVGSGIQFSGSNGIQLSLNQRLRSLYTIITGTPISIGVKADLLVPFACSIVQVTLLADQAGNVILDIWKNTFANFPPTVANTITAAAKPTLSAASKSQNNTLVGWTTAITAGDILRLNVDSASTITRLTVALDVVTV
jgi:hypothetical protein